MASERKWEDLEKDCLVNVLKRLDMESLILGVAFVCKSWYKASLDPLCWEKLDFPHPLSMYLIIDRFKYAYGLRRDSINLSKFLKFIIDRSCKNATLLNLPRGSTKEDLKYATEECPALNTLLLDSHLVYDLGGAIAELIGKWKNLIGLTVHGSSYNLVKMLPEISLNCNKFETLNINRAGISEEEAMSIVTNLPNIKCLILRGGRINRDNLVMILQGCKELLHFDARDCIGYEADDEILELASHINKFMYEGSKLEGSDHSDDDTSLACYRDEDVYYSDHSDDDTSSTCC